MQYCTKCGAQLVDEAVVCTGCGRAVEGKLTVAPKKSVSGLGIAAMILMILGTIIMSGLFYGVPLLWCLPMTIVYCVKVIKGARVSTGFKVCSLLFVSLLGGILMLCDND